FFQAEDGIRDWSVTGVQTCALPISNVFQYTQITTIGQLLCFMPVHGFFAIGGFVFAAYLPELFPTRIRATGLGFCWNMARVFTEIGRASCRGKVWMFGVGV